jgi:hypothetical protein
MKEKKNRINNRSLSNLRLFFILMSSYLISGKYGLVLVLMNSMYRSMVSKIVNMEMFCTLKEDMRDSISEFRMISAKNMI